MGVLDRVKFRAASGGTGSFVVASAIPGFRTPAGNSIPNGTPLAYIAFSDNQLEFEYGTSTYTSAGTLIARNGTDGSSTPPVSFSLAPTVAICSLAPVNPTGLIGLTAVNGTAATVTRSDATHAIDQGIVPSWTGLHTFADRVNITGSVNGILAITSNGTGSSDLAELANLNNLGHFFTAVMTGSNYTPTTTVLADAAAFTSNGAGGLTFIATSGSGSVRFSAGNTGAVDFSVDSTKSVVVGSAAIATNAADGFLYIPTCAGTPSGTPTTKTGRIAMVYDTTNHQFWFYDGGWKQPKTPAGASIVTWQ